VISSLAAGHRRIAISLLAGTLDSAAAFSIAVASCGDSTVPSRTALAVILYPGRQLWRRFGLLGHA
jgi:hypothetical protein